MANLKTEKVNVFPLFVVDAFTKKPFYGNGAAVCLLPFNSDVENQEKQKVAAEMKLSETAFLKVMEESDTFQSGKQFALDWFTPVDQVPLCGHATLASAAVLFAEYKNNYQVLEFKTVSGTLKAKKQSNNRIEIDLPAYKSNPVDGKFDKLVKIIAGKLPVQDVVLSLSKELLIRFCDNVTRKELEEIKTNDAELLAETSDIQGVIVTVKGAGEDCVDEEGNSYDFLSRYFAPWFGISEDPVTGAAHVVLAPYWAQVLQKKTFYARQCSQRGGELHIQLQDDRVVISGNAVVVVKGQIQF